MSKECKLARNVVGGSMLILVTACILLSMSSCSSTSRCGPSANSWKTNCPAYR